jgi:hypothetical protein
MTRKAPASVVTAGNVDRPGVLGFVPVLDDLVGARFLAGASVSRLRHRAALN